MYITYTPHWDHFLIFQKSILILSDDLCLPIKNLFDSKSLYCINVYKRNFIVLPYTFILQNLKEGISCFCFIELFWYALCTVFFIIIFHTIYLRYVKYKNNFIISSNVPPLMAVLLIVLKVQLFSYMRVLAFYMGQYPLETKIEVFDHLENIVNILVDNLKSKVEVLLYQWIIYYVKRLQTIIASVM